MSRRRIKAMAKPALLTAAVLGLMSLPAGGTNLPTESRRSDLADPLHDALAHLHAQRHAQAEQAALAVAMHSEQANPRAWLIVATSRQARGQWASATRAYRLFLATCGEVRLRQYAMRQMQHCHKKLQPTKPAKAPSEQLTDKDRQSLAEVDSIVHTESTDHFVVRAPNAALARLIADEAENALDRICRSVLAGQAFPHSVDVYVWPDRKAFFAHARSAPEWAGASFQVRTVDGATVRRIDLTQKNADGEFDLTILDRILPHELCHLVVKELFGDAPAPLFLNEGLAMLAEARVDEDRVALAGSVLLSDQRIGVRRLLLMDLHDLKQPEVFYAEAFSLMEFLHGRLTGEQFRSFLLSLKDGCTVADALQRALYLPPHDEFIDALAESWEAHAVAQAQFQRALQGESISQAFTGE